MTSYYGDPHVDPGCEEVERSPLTLEERVRHLELYGTQRVDSWIDLIMKQLDALERAVAELHQRD